MHKVLIHRSLLSNKTQAKFVCTAKRVHVLNARLGNSKTELQWGQQTFLWLSIPPLQSVTLSLCLAYNLINMHKQKQFIVSAQSSIEHKDITYTPTGTHIENLQRKCMYTRYMPTIYIVRYTYSSLNWKYVKLYVYNII